MTIISKIDCRSFDSGTFGTQSLIGLQICEMQLAMAWENMMEHLVMSY